MSGGGSDPTLPLLPEMKIIMMFVQSVTHPIFNVIAGLPWTWIWIA